MKNELITKEQIAKRVVELGREVSDKYRGLNPIFIGVLNGCFIFIADLLREVDMECEIDFVKLSSYEGDDSIGSVHLLKDISADITGRHVIIVEDIVDTGLTLTFLRNRLQGGNPASISCVTLLFKREVAKINFDIEFVGFEIPIGFVVGYGLDYNQKYRTLKSVYLLDG